MLSAAALKNLSIRSQLISVSEVDDSGRLRPIDSDAVSAIAASIVKDGLINPIDVCQLPNQGSGLPYRLVAGGHRLAAFRLLGLDTIPAFVRSNDALGRKSREIAENFFKAELSPIDKAAFVAELIEVEKARMGIEPAQDGRALNADRRSPKALKKQLTDDLCIVHESLGIQEIVAQKLGLDRSTVSRQLTLYRLPASVKEALRVTPIGHNAAALRAVAKLDPARQQRLVKLVLDGVSPKAAMDQVLGRVEITPDEKRASAFFGAWERMGLAEKKAVLRELSQRTLPKGWVISDPSVIAPSVSFAATSPRGGAENGVEA
jgi:ParB family chromosome partitioning protein